MFGIASYLAVATIASVTVFLVAEWFREPGAPAPDHPGRIALIAGLLWPMLLLGLAQCVLVAAVHDKLGRRPVSTMSIRPGERAGSP